MSNGGSDQAFRIVVGANYNLSIDQLKRDIGNILRRLPKESRSIVVRANVNDITGLQHDLTNLSKRLNLTVSQVTINPNQQNIVSFGSVIERGLQNNGGVGVHVTARQNSIAALRTEIENGLLQAGGVGVPLVVGQQNLANLSTAVAQALAQINPNDRTVHVITNGSAVEQEIRAVLQRVSQTPLDIHVNLIGLPQNNRNGSQRLPGERQASRQLYNSMTNFAVLNQRESDLRLTDLIPDNEAYNDLRRFRQEYTDALTDFQALNPSRYMVGGEDTGQYILDSDELVAAAGRVRDAERSYSDAFNRVLNVQREHIKAQTDITGAYRKQNTILQQAFQMQAQLQGYSNNPAYAGLATNLNSYIEGFLNSDGSLEATRQFEQNIQRLRGEILRLGPPIDDTNSRFQQMLRNRLGFAALTVAIGLVRRGFIRMYRNVVELDGAMVELRKVTDETNETYNRFLQDAADRANKLGATLKDVVASTADFARLGYDITDAAALADAALVYKNVGDGIADINEATESVIATMQAFGIEASKAMTIVDKFNIIGNTEAISSGGVGDALMNSAAALQSANNSLEESIALIAAANTTTQDPQKVGTTMKTLSMYLRAAKTEAEEAGESTEGMANSVSDLRAEILALTGNRVDIQIDENTFKSTYQILKELSEVWDSLSDISQANILESISGKRNANITASLLENFEIAERALQTASDSDGSALAENEKVLESVTGKIQLMTAAWQEFSAATFDNEAVKFVIQFLTAILKALTELDSATRGFSSSILVALSGFGIIVATLQSFGVEVNALARRVANLNLLGLRGQRQAAAGLGTLSLYVMAAAALITVISKIYQAWRKAHPTFDELKTKVADAKQSCADLEQEITSNKDRIAELMELANSGEINIVEQEELDMLKEENALLQQRLEVRQRLLDLEEDNLAEEARKKYEDFYTANSSYSVAESDRTQWDIASLASNQKILADKNATERERTAASAEITRVRTNLANTQNELLDIMVALDLTVPEDLERYRDLQSVIDDITIALDGSSAVASVWKRTFEDENLYPGVTKLKEEIIQLRNAERDVNDELKNYGSNVDITSRKAIAITEENVEKFRELLNDPELQDGHVVTLDSNTFTLDELGVSENSSIAVVATPILPDGTTFDSYDDFKNYVAGLFDENGQYVAANDTKGVVMAVVDEGSIDKSIEKADELAHAAHVANGEIVELLRTGVGADVLGDLGISESDWPALLNYIAGTESEINAGIAAITSFSSQLSEAEEALDGVADAYKTIAEGGSLTIKQIDALLADYPDLIDYLDVENGQLTISKKILLEKLDAYKANRIAALKTSKSTIEGLKAEAEALKLNIDLDYQRFRQRRLADGDTQSEIDKAWSVAVGYEGNIGTMIAAYDSQIEKLNKQINLWENLDVTKTFVGDIKTETPDYDEIYKSIVKQKELIEQNTERMSRMSEDYFNEQIQMWVNLRKTIIAEMEKVTDKESERYHYLEDMLWEVNDAIEEIYDNQADAIQNIIDITREMIEEEYQDSIDAIEKQTDAYNDLIDAKKKALRVDKEANDYNKKVAEKTKEIAKLQSRIALLSLDDSRKAKAEKASLEEELAKLQSDLADLQAERGLELTEDALDESADKFEKAKDKEIEALEAILDDEERLYKETIKRIGNMEDSFYQQLEKWAKAHGEDIRQLAKDWDVAKNAKKGYADLDAALSGIAGNKDSLGSLTPEGSYGALTGQEIIDQMRANSIWAKEHGTSWDPNRNISLHEENKSLAKQYEQLTGTALEYDPKLGWVYAGTQTPLYKFHTGGIVGGRGSLRDNEIMSILETNEIVMANGHKMNLSSLFDNLRTTIGELVAGNLMGNMSRMRAAVPAGNNTVAPQINVTIQHNGDMSDADAKRYGSMVGDEALKKLHNAFVKRGL